MVFPNKYPIHTSPSTNFPKIPFAKGGMEISREREREKDKKVERQPWILVTALKYKNLYRQLLHEHIKNEHRQ
jgi:hypothetical protein